MRGLVQASGFGLILAYVVGAQEPSSHSRLDVGGKPLPVGAEVRVVRSHSQLAAPEFGALSDTIVPAKDSGRTPIDLATAKAETRRAAEATRLARTYSSIVVEKQIGDRSGGIEWRVDFAESCARSARGASPVDAHDRPVVRHRPRSWLSDVYHRLDRDCQSWLQPDAALRFPVVRYLADGSNLRRLTTTGMAFDPTWAPTPRCQKGP